jgi:uridine kinase
MADKNPTFENKKYVPPWREPYIIGIAGSSGSGKTSIASSIINIINVRAPTDPIIPSAIEI